MIFSISEIRQVHRPLINIVIDITVTPRSRNFNLTGYNRSVIVYHPARFKSFVNAGINRIRRSFFSY